MQLLANDFLSSEIDAGKNRLELLVMQVSGESFDHV